MNNKAMINGQEYKLLELLPLLDLDLQVILCEDSNGNRVVCSEQLWRDNAIYDTHVPSVHTNSSAREKIEFFLDLLFMTQHKLGDFSELVLRHKYMVKLSPILRPKPIT